EADDCIKPFDLGDGRLHWLTSMLVDDVKDLFEGEAYGIGLRPAGKLARDRIHHLDATFDVAGDDAVADRGKGGPELLLGLKDLFCAPSEDFKRGAVSGRDRVEPAAHEEADQDADAECDGDQRLEHVADLAAPLHDAHGAASLRMLRDGLEILADL